MAGATNEWLLRTPQWCRVSGLIRNDQIEVRNSWTQKTNPKSQKSDAIPMESIAYRNLGFSKLFLSHASLTVPALSSKVLEKLDKKIEGLRFDGQITVC